MYAVVAITVSEQLRADGKIIGPTLLLLRHGQIGANRARRWHGSTDSGLTFLGRRQAKLTSRYLEKHAQPIHRIVASPLKRCQKTAILASKHLGLKIETHVGLAEMGVGDWEDQSFANLHEQHDLFGHLSTDLNYRPPNGETIAEVSSRTTAAFRDINHAANPSETILIVSHGVAMGIALANLLQEDPLAWQEYQVANCALSELVLSPQPTLFRMTQVNHL